MSVHTLYAKDGIVTVGAHGTPGEAPEAALQILRFCYEEAGLPAPLVLDAPDPAFHRKAASRYGVFSVDGREVALTTACGHCDKDTVVRMPSAPVRALAAVLAGLADTAEGAPDPEQVGRLAAFFGERIDDGPEALADAFLRAFTMPEERAS